MLAKLALIPLAAGAIVLAGCATNSGTRDVDGFVAPLGQDTYLISRQGAGFWVMPTTLRNQALAEANQYCARRGKQFQVNNIEMLEQIPLGQPGGPRFPSAELQFMCLSPGDPEISRPRMQKGADYVVEQRIDHNVKIEHSRP